MNPETRKVWQPLRKELVKTGWDFFRVDAKEPAGICDLNVLMPYHAGIKFDVWIEMKYQDTVEGNKVNWGLRKEQFIWMRQAKLSGRQVFLVSVYKDIWFIFNTIEAFQAAKHPWDWTEMSMAAINKCSNAANTLNLIYQLANLGLEGR